MLCLGYFFVAIGASSYLFITELWHIYIVQVLNAIAFGIFNPAWKTLYANDEDIGKQAQEWALVDGGYMILISIAAVLGGFLVNWYGFRMLFFLMAFVQVVAFLFSLKIIGKKRRK